MSSEENRVTVQSFSGATIEDMSDFIKPILRRKPETVILHIGTNNLRRGDGKSVADGIINLAQSILRQCPDCFGDHRCHWIGCHCFGDHHKI